MKAMDLAVIQVNLHCHSNLSDGQLTPEELADRLMRAGVRYAALTDHDTVAGLARFRAALSRHGIGYIAGVEITASAEEGPVHLLVYGFDPASSHLAKALRKTEGGLPLKSALDLAHRAGGKVFLAHPLVLDTDLEILKQRLLHLKALGLDGLEAIYAPYSKAQILELLILAKECGLAVSAGCDFHGPDHPGLSDLGMNMPMELWRGFRDTLLSSPGKPPKPRTPSIEIMKNALPKLAWKNFLIWILAPTLLAIGLLVVPIFAYVLPGFEEALLSRKREMIRELTNSACSILQEYHQDVLAGRTSMQEAQQAAAARLEFLRYGKEGKDYFWITDLHPRMVMHPYRADLNGQDLTNFVDPNGSHVFVEFARLAQQKNEGYFEYVWQWKDDAERLAPKQSYVRLFQPWGWVVGTGLYLEDVRSEITAITSRVVHVSLGLALIIALLLLLVAQQSFRIERKRLLAEEALRESHEKYRTLVEASKEGTLMLLENRCIFANQTFLDLLGYSEEEWTLVDMDEVFQLKDGSMSLWVQDPGAGLHPVEARLHRRDGRVLDALVTPERIQLGDQDGVILIVRDLSVQKEVQAALNDSQARFRSVAENLRVGVFRALMDRPMTFLEANPAAVRLLGITSGGLRESFSSVEDMEAFRQELLEKGEVRERQVRLPLQKGSTLVSLTATLVRDEANAPSYCDAIAEDVTARQQKVTERDSLIADLQTALLFLGEPVKRYMREPASTGLQTTVAQAAAIMSGIDFGALLILGPSGEPIGLLTDHDLRARVLAPSVDPERLVFEFMSSPLITISPTAQGHEALELMREKGVQHLVVKDENGSVVGLVRGRDLLQVDHYPLVFLSRSIKEASRPEAVAEHRKRLPVLVKSLIDSGAKSRHICRAISAISDTVTEKLVAFAEASLGPAPAPFAFLAMGSQGREEQTLFSDQDTAIVFDAPPGTRLEDVRAYLLEMGEHVSGWLEAAGYPICKGGMMARNPRWCQPLAQWKSYFSEWIRLAEPQNLMEFNTFFDFRCVHGKASLASSLRSHIRTELASTEPFFLYLAQDTLQYKPPLGFFGKIVTGTDSQGHKTFNVKDAMASIVNFARLYALRHKVDETSTFDRLRRLHELGVLASTSYEDLSQAHDFLMALRLRHQADRLTTGLAADNDIELRALTNIEEGMLKQVFSQIITIQKKVGFDFPGAG